MPIVSLNDFAQSLQLEVLYDGFARELDIGKHDVERPGMHFAGYLMHYNSGSIQVIGNSELHCIEDLDPQLLDERLNDFFSNRFPCVVICRNLKPPEKLLRYARDYKCPLLRSNDTTTSFTHRAFSYLDSLLAPRQTMHGVLMVVVGVGVLIIGESGIGKSEMAVELIRRGQALVSDDVVEIRRVADNRLVGAPPELLRGFLEIRGVGIINVERLFGIDSISDEYTIDMVIELQNWDDMQKDYDRLGLKEEMMEILGVLVRRVRIPVTPGRNLAVIIETAARDHHLRLSGYHAAQDLQNRMEENSKKNNA